MHRIQQNRIHTCSTKALHICSQRGTRANISIPPGPQIKRSEWNHIATNTIPSKGRQHRDQSEAPKPQRLKVTMMRKHVDRSVHKQRANQTTKSTFSPLIRHPARKNQHQQANHTLQCQRHASKWKHLASISSAPLGVNEKSTKQHYIEKIQGSKNSSKVPPSR